MHSRCIAILPHYAAWPAAKFAGRQNRNEGEAFETGCTWQELLQVVENKSGKRRRSRKAMKTIDMVMHVILLTIDRYQGYDHI